jgi:hypothetical protein
MLAGKTVLHELFTSLFLGIGNVDFYELGPEGAKALERKRDNLKRVEISGQSEGWFNFRRQTGKLTGRNKGLVTLTRRAANNVNGVHLERHRFLYQVFRELDV